MAGRDFYGGRSGAGTTVSFPNVTSGASGVAPAGGMDLTALTHFINNLNQQAQTAANRNRIPQNAALETQSSANIGNELHGVVAPDVLRLLQQQAAERGVATGTAGSPNSNAAYLQALGLTSMGLQEQGQHDLSGALARNPAAPIFDPTTQIMNPYQSASLAQQDRFERDRMALEEQRLALDAAHAGGGGGGGGYGRGGVGPSGVPLSEGPNIALGYNGPAGGTYIPPADPTQTWWNSIGFNPNTASQVPTDAPLDPSLFANVGSTGAPAGTTTGTMGSTGGGVDWGSLFSSDIGVDPSLYTGG